MKENLPQRKQIRLKEYNYSTEGMYFITICTKNRIQVLSKITNNKTNTQITNTVGVAPKGDPQINIILLPNGKIVEKYINNYNKKFNNIKINEYIIMPNHIHFIIQLIWLPKGATPTIPNIINSFKSIITKEIGYSI